MVYRYIITILKLIVLYQKPSSYIFKWVNFIIHQLYLNKVVLKKEMK